MGADAAKADFFDCYRCLHKQQQCALTKDKDGYFCSSDYEPYLSRLEEEKKYCDACIKTVKGQKVNFDDCLSLEMSQNLSFFYRTMLDVSLFLFKKRG